MFKNNEELLRG